MSEMAYHILYASLKPKIFAFKRLSKDKVILKKRENSEKVVMGFFRKDSQMEIF